jgi:hypothetical protein
MTCNLYCTRCLKTRPFLLSPEAFVCSSCSLELVRAPTRIGAFRRVRIRRRRSPPQAG